MRYLAMASVMLMVATTTFLVGAYEGEKLGRKQALSTNPVSDELEMVCAGLWMSEQNREAVKRGVSK